MFLKIQVESDFLSDYRNNGDKRATNGNVFDWRPLSPLSQVVLGSSPFDGLWNTRLKDGYLPYSSGKCWPVTKVVVDVDNASN